MRKRLISTIMSLILIFCCCINVSAANTTTPNTKTTTTKDATVKDEIDIEEFTLLDLTEDMIDAAMYAVNGTSEFVVTLFTLGDDQYVSLMIYDSSDGSADLLCGLLDSKNVKVTNNKTKTEFKNVVDVYTGDKFSFIIDESKKPYIQIPTGEKYDAELLTAEDAIDYMAAILILEQEAAEAEAAKTTTSNNTKKTNTK